MSGDFFGRVCEVHFKLMQLRIEDTFIKKMNENETYV